MLLLVGTSRKREKGLRWLMEEGAECGEWRVTSLELRLLLCRPKGKEGENFLKLFIHFFKTQLRKDDRGIENS